MGAIAYAAGTLIVAVVLHTVYRKSQKPNQQRNEDLRDANSLRDKERASCQGQSVTDRDDDSVVASHEVPSITVALGTPSVAAPPAGLKEEENKHSVSTSTRQTVNQDTKLMPPPLRPPRGVSSTRLKPASSTLTVPAQKSLVNTRMQPRSSASTSTLSPSKRPPRKVILAPGRSPLDWASLTRSPDPSSTSILRGSNAIALLGPHRMARITPRLLSHFTGRKGKDAWTSYQGKVYNLSAYLQYHPGGEEEMMKGAGRDSGKLFMEVHPWVNWEGMLGECCVGRLVGEDDEEGSALEKFVLGGGMIRTEQAGKEQGIGREIDGEGGGEKVAEVNELDEMD